MSRSSCRNALGATPPLLPSPPILTCTQTFNAGACRTLFGEPLGNAQPVDGMHPGEVFSYGTGLVGLQCTDEVPGGRPLRCQRRHLRQGVLDVTLAEIVQSRLQGEPQGRGGLSLAGADECDLIHTPTRFPAAARIRAWIRARFSAKCCGGGEFCGSINIWEARPLRYTQLAFSYVSRHLQLCPACLFASRQPSLEELNGRRHCAAARVRGEEQRFGPAPLRGVPPMIRVDGE